MPSINPAYGRIIILNGGSSAGKTSLAKAFQDLMLPEIYLLQGIDMFWFSLPPKQLDLDRVDPEFYTHTSLMHDGKEEFRIVPGPQLDKLMLGRYKAMSVYLRQGFNIIADEVVWKRSWLEEAIRDLIDFDAYFVNVYCADSVGEAREKSRGDRHAGWNRCSARYASMDALYDLSLDTGAHCPEECAELLRSALEDGLQPTAFGLMKEKFLEIGERE